MVSLRLRIKMIDGAGNVFSLRRRVLFWQYKLGTFLLRV